MNDVLTACLGQVRCGDPVCWANLALVPLFVDDREPLYLSLAEAMQQHLVQITEISDAGSVPELKVINTGRLPVLLLDGEEMEGAKQNRVVNTTILIAAESELVIPVSCTEQGRWRDVSAHFADSDTVMEQNIRARKSAAVSHSLKERKSFAGNQGEVWSQIDDLHADLGSHSATMAMKDAYASRAQDMKEGLAALTCRKGQHGFVAVINGKPTGMDLVSLAGVYTVLHNRLVKSCLVDGLRRRDKIDAEAGPAAEAAASFLAVLSSAKTEEHSSPGLGVDIRIRAPQLVGSALSCDDTAVHIAGFHIEEEAPQAYGGRIASMRYRRDQLDQQE